MALKDKIDLVFSDLNNKVIDEKQAHHQVLDLLAADGIIPQSDPYQAHLSKEVRSFIEQAGKNQEDYADMARAAGFDNRHDFERKADYEVIKGCFVFAALIASLAALAIIGIAILMTR